MAGHSTKNASTTPITPPPFPFGTVPPPTMTPFLMRDQVNTFPFPNPQLGQMNQVGQMGQMNQMNQMGQMGQMQMNPMNPINMVNPMNPLNPFLFFNPYQNLFEMFFAHQQYFKQLKAFHDNENKLNTILTNEIEQVYKRNEDLRQRQKAVCAEVLQRLEECVKIVSPRCRIQAFGSYKTKLMIPGSDIDVHISLPNDKKDNRKNTETNEELFQRIIQFLKSLRKEVSSKLAIKSVQLIERTSVPVMKYEDPLHKQKVDVSVNSDNALKAVEVIHRFSNQFSQFKYLVIIVKSFLKYKNLNDVYTGGLSSYAICLLVISFLQITEKELKEKDPSSSLEQFTLGHLLVDFFSFYGNRFRYDIIGIDVTNGGSYFEISNPSSKVNPEDLPFSKDPLMMIMGPIIEKNTPIKLHLVDPNDPNNIVTKGTYRMRDVVLAFSEAFFCIISTPIGVSPLQRVIGNDYLHLTSDERLERSLTQKQSNESNKENSLSNPDEKTKRKLERTIHSQSLEIEELRKENKTLKFRLSESKSELKHSEDEKINLRLQNEKLRKEIENLLESKKTESVALKECKTALKESRINYEKLALKKRQLEEENRNLRLKTGELKEKCEKKDEKIKELMLDSMKKERPILQEPRSVQDKRGNNMHSQIQSEVSLDDIFRAIKSENLSRVKQLLPMIDVNSCDKQFVTPLHYALKTLEEQFRKGSPINIEISKFLLNNDAIPDRFLDNVKDSSLYIACQIGCYDLVEMLLQRGANINYSSKTSPPPIHTCIENRYNTKSNHDVLKLLVKQPSLRYDTIYNGMNALSFCIKCGNLESFRIILENQENDDARRSLLFSRDAAGDLNLLMQACLEKNYFIARYLLDSGLDPNEKSGKDGFSAFSILWKWFDDAIDLSYLIIDNKYQYRLIPEDIKLVIARGATSFATYLLQLYSQQGGEIAELGSALKDINGYLHSNSVDSISLSSSSASRESDSDSLEDSFPEIVFSDNLRKNSSSIYNSVENSSRKEVVKSLSSISITNTKSLSTSQSPNHDTDNSDGHDLEEITSSNDDENPLVTNGVEKSIKCVKTDKKKSKKDKKKVAKPQKPIYSESPEEIFMKKLPEMSSIPQQQKINEVIEARSINVNFANPNDNNKTLLHYLVELGYFLSINAIVKQDININALTSKKETALLIAAKKLLEAAKNKDSARMSIYNGVIKILCASKAEAFHVDENKENPLHLACRAGSLTAAKYLLDQNAPINDQNKDLQTPLHIILTNQGDVVLSDDMICMFLKEFFQHAHLDTRVKDKFNRNLLTLAIEMHNVPACKQLLKNSSYLEPKIAPPKDDKCSEKKEKIPLLLHAIQKRNPIDNSNHEILKMLLDHEDIDPNAHYKGKSVFSHVLENDTEDICLLLLEHRPNILVSKDSLDIAAEKGFTKIVQILKDRKRKKKRKNVYDPTSDGYQRLPDDDEYVIEERNPVGSYHSSINHVYHYRSSV